MIEADPVSVEVSIEHLPVEVPDDDLREALSPYSTIHDVRLQNYADSDILNGTRILTMSLSSDIPVNLRVLRYPCRVLYRGQPRPCPICRADGHRAYSCPLRGKCRLCHKPGHIARNCTSGRLDIVDDANDDDNDDDNDDVDDDNVDDDNDDENVDDDNDDDNDDENVEDDNDDDDNDDDDDEGYERHKETVEAASAVTLPPEPEPPSLPEPLPESPNVTDSPSSNASMRAKRRIASCIATSDFKWIKRLPEDFEQSLLDSGHTSDTHVVQETYRSSDNKNFYLYYVFDFGVNTFRILKDHRTFEDIRFNSYRFNGAPRLTCAPFPGAKAVSGPALSSDIAPSKFPIK